MTADYSGISGEANCTHTEAVIRLLENCQPRHIIVYGHKAMTIYYFVKVSHSFMLIFLLFFKSSTPFSFLYFSLTFAICSIHYMWLGSSSGAHFRDKKILVPDPCGLREFEEAFKLALCCHSVPTKVNVLPANLNLNLLCLCLQVFMSRHFLYNCSQPILDVKIAFCQVCVPYR